MGKNKISKLSKEVDRYLDSLSYKYIINTRPDRLYEKLYHDIAGMVIKVYDSVDVTENTVLSIATDTTGGFLRTTVTGYVKISDNQFLQIEKIYAPKEE